MAKSAVYPKAIYADNGVSGGTYTAGPPRLVIHTTETSGMPGYNGGFSAPHITYDPRSRLFVQHRTFKAAARALRNEAGGVQTNRHTALQIEIICYSNKGLADQQTYRDWVGDLDQIPGAVEDLAEFIDWVCTDWGVRRVWPGKQAANYSAANAAGFRMTPAEWETFDGVCGHQHVPENDHWDPGALDWSRLLLQEDDMPLTDEDVQKVAAAARQAILSAQFGNPEPDGTVSNLQTKLDRTYRNTQSIIAAVGALDLEGVTEAELDVRVASLVESINAQPASFITKLKDAL